VRGYYAGINSRNCSCWCYSRCGVVVRELNHYGAAAMNCVSKVFEFLVLADVAESLGVKTEQLLP
jgi:hypothetical protein